MIAFLNQVVYGYYPYVALSLFIGGSIIRFNRGQYGWRSGSSELLRRKQLVWGSSMFHYGILVVLAGHFFGFLTPESVVAASGMSEQAHALLAIIAGGFSGLIAWVGLTMLVHRRLFDIRIRRTSSAMDIFVLLLVWVQLTFGLATVPLSMHHLQSTLFTRLVAYVQGIVYLHPNAVSNLDGVYWVYRVHLFLGFTFFLVWPFSRLVHIWSAPIWYLARLYQVVRRRTPQRQKRGMPT